MASFSPDGGYLLYVSGPNYSELYLIPTTGGEPHLLIMNAPAPLSFIQPVWSPAGRAIAFTAHVGNADTHAELFIVDIESRDLSQVSQRTARNYARLSWSPDATQLVVSELPWDAPQYALYVMRSNGRDKPPSPLLPACPPPFMSPP